ncbi:hypothetical protein I6F53_04660 [Pseudoalteromonas sp. SWN29]|uniref:hypothetical protein n=1 Tax=Pseudoalteromonas sp. SWN29 TaxID=2792064 RepID=UPI0018CF5205|nr:hypothetical protein [Pseudoalteromonas sp. SWN29]MBH0026273.1 hypothetical protein [Pseudoalteromonas sp. SWN29]
MDLSKKLSPIFELSSVLITFEIKGDLKNSDDTASQNQLIGLLDKSSFTFENFTMTDLDGKFKLNVKSQSTVVVMAFDRTGGYMPAVVDEVEPIVKSYQIAN